MNFTLGSDPEFFLEKNGKIYSAIGILNRTYENGHEFYNDNVLAECAIKPGNSKEETIDNFRDCFKIFSRIVHPFKISNISANCFDKKYLRHPEAKRVGCKEEICAYRMYRVKNKEAIHSIKKTGWRFAGGHIHLGGNFKEDLLSIPPIVRLMDLFVSIPLNILSGPFPNRRRRRKVYGKAGAFRTPAHGLEYRTPDNFWLLSPKSVGLVWDLCKFVLEFRENNSCIKQFSTNQLRKAVNCYDYSLYPRFIDLINHVDTSQLFQTKFDFYKEWSL